MTRGFHSELSKRGIVVSSVATKRNRNSSISNSGWHAGHTKPSDTAVLRYNRVAMLEAVLSIRDRRRQFVRRACVITLSAAGGFVMVAGILGWF